MLYYTMLYHVLLCMIWYSTAAALAFSSSGPEDFCCGRAAGFSRFSAPLWRAFSVQKRKGQNSGNLVVSGQNS